MPADVPERGDFVVLNFNPQAGLFLFVAMERGE